MTAMGFAMFAFGALGAWLAEDCHEGLMAFCAFLFLAGLAVMLLGITIWLWRVMP